MDQDDVRTILQHMVGLQDSFQLLRQETLERFDRVDERFDRVDERFDRVDERFERIDERFERIDERFERVETDIRQTNVLVEDLRGEIRLVAEGVANVNEKLDRFREEVTHEFEAVRAENRLHYDDLDRRVRNLEVAGG